MRGVGVEEAAAIRAELLDGFLRRYRALRDGLLPAFQSGHAGVGLQILDHTLRAQEQRRDDRNRKQHIDRGTRHIDPEITDGLGLMPRKASYDCNRNRNPGGGRHEVLNGQGRHLHQVAERRLATIRLPVGVGEKAGGGVEGKIGTDVAGVKVLRVEGQNALCPLQKVHQQKPEDTEADQRRRVLGPALLGVFMHPTHLVRKNFDPPQSGMQERALALEDTRHVSAERLGEREHQGEENHNLENSYTGHDFLFRTARDEAERKPGKRTDRPIRLPQL